MGIVSLQVWPASCQVRAKHSRRTVPGDGQAGGVDVSVAVGMGVLAALLIFNAYERYQARRDAEQVLQALKQETAKLEREAQAALRTVTVPPPRPVAVIHPIPPGYRCAGGALLYRDGNSWTQITARSNHIYCPLDGKSADDCYPVTPRSIGCSR